MECLALGMRNEAVEHARSRYLPLARQVAREGTRDGAASSSDAARIPVSAQDAWTALVVASQLTETAQEPIVGILAAEVVMEMCDRLDEGPDAMARETPTKKQRRKKKKKKGKGDPSPERVPSAEEAHKRMEPLVRSGDAPVAMDAGLSQRTRAMALRYKGSALMTLRRTKATMAAAVAYEEAVARDPTVGVYGLLSAPLSATAPDTLTDPTPHRWQNWSVLGELAEVHRRLGRFDLALEEFGRALRGTDETVGAGAGG